jgi:hypothetical protein
MGAWMAAVACGGLVVAWQVLSGQEPRLFATTSLWLWLASPLGYGALGFAVARGVGGRFAFTPRGSTALCALPFVNSWTLAVVLGEWSPRSRRWLLASPLAFVGGLLVAAAACFLCHLVSPQTSRALSAAAVVVVAVIPASLRAIALAHAGPAAHPRRRARRLEPVAA